MPEGLEINDSQRGDHVWTLVNVGEAIPDVMTPATWSLMQRYADDAVGRQLVDGHPMWGSIGGRFYLNVSMILSVAKCMGTSKFIGELSDQSIGSVPDGMEVPLVRLSRRRTLRDAVAREMQTQVSVVRHRRALVHWLDDMPDRCDHAITQIAATTTAHELRALWESTINDLVGDCCRLMRYNRPQAMRMTGTHWALRKLLGETAANVVSSGSGAGEHLDSVDVLVGLDDLANGMVDRATFERRFGHRGASEHELSIARPVEDASWFDAQLEAARRGLLDVRARLHEQEGRREEAWRVATRERRVRARLARRAARMWTEAARRREATRSEASRAFTVVRAFLLRAATITGLDDDVFYLSLDETLGVLAGELPPHASIAERRALREQQMARPPMPAFLRGPFDPTTWSGDSDRTEGALRGHPGAAGVVDGTVRVVLDLDDADELTDGEVLVTSVTNIGWTPYFLRLGAVITDIGAPLSHAAIVARELGIPAVVGCGDATSRLKTGDRVRVDGELGTVDLLRR